MPRKKTTTSSDVAKAADVSRELVSLVFSECSAPVSQTTRTRIFDTAKKLEYVPRKKVSMPRQRLLAYIRPVVKRGHHEEHHIYDAYEQFYDHIQNSLVEKVYAAGCSLVVRPYEDPVELTHWMIEWGVVGVMWHYSHDEALAQWIAARYPMVQINRGSRVAADAVLANQEDIVVFAMDHLRELGHRRVALISGSTGDSNIKKRNRAYFEYTARHGLSCYRELTGDMNLDRLVEVFSSPSDDRPTAVILGDHTALLLQKRLIEAGLSLPRDLSMVGIDNISASHYSYPPLTSIDVRQSDIAEIALSLLVERIEEPALAVRKVEVTPQLVARGSVADLRGQGAVAQKAGV